MNRNDFLRMVANLLSTKRDDYVLRAVVRETPSGDVQSIGVHVTGEDGVRTFTLDVV